MRSRWKAARLRETPAACAASSLPTAPPLERMYRYRRQRTGSSSSEIAATSSAFRIVIPGRLWQSPGGCRYPPGGGSAPMTPPPGGIGFGRRPAAGWCGKANDEGRVTAMTSASSASSRLASYLAGVAPEVAASIEAELADQRSHLKLIASENYASPAVLLAMGNWLSDKYAEGAPGHRFYAGCDNVDAIESRGVELAKALFGSDHAYLQPHSGIDANLVAFWAILTARVEAPALERLGSKDLLSLPEEEWRRLRRELGSQRMLGMALDAGGHLTHGF